jgi:hypothetical protein
MNLKAIMMNEGKLQLLNTKMKQVENDRKKISRPNMLVSTDASNPFNEAWLTEPNELFLENNKIWILRHSSLGHLNGYVMVPEGLNIADEDFKVHGTITGGRGNNYGSYIGFDTAHWKDHSPYRLFGCIYCKKNILDSSVCTYKDIEYVTNECRSLLKQIQHLQITQGISDNQTEKK